MITTPDYIRRGNAFPRILAVTAMGFALMFSGTLQLAAQSERPASFASVARSQIDTVVNITTTPASVPTGPHTQVAPNLPEFPPGSPLEEFFRNFRNSRPNIPHAVPPGTDAPDDQTVNPEEQAKPGPEILPAPEGNNEDNPDGGPADEPEVDPQNSASVGSGVIIDPAGYVVTNGHVVADAGSIVVILHDGRKLSARLVGTDPATDLAVLKLDAREPLPFAKWGDSDAVEVGDWVVAIGNPFGLGSSVTAGILSARARDIQQGPYDDYLQTDASINRGNSGGPLFDLQGGVIGINTAIYSPSGGSVGIGFAIPSKIAADVVRQLRESGTVRRGWLGVQVQRVTPEIAETLELPEAAGALVTTVTPDGPAAKAGIEPGDVILRFSDKPIIQMRDLPRIVASSEIGKQARLAVRREKEDRNVEVVIGELEPEAIEGSSGSSQQAPEEAVNSTRVLGLTVAELNSTLREAFSIRPGISGVMITDVASDSDAFTRGVQPGDIILQAGQETVATPDELIEKIEAARAQDRKTLLLLIERDGDLRYVPVGLDESGP